MPAQVVGSPASRIPYPARNDPATSGGGGIGSNEMPQNYWLQNDWFWGRH
jgi:hypothetical protein